jgi:hypothetical protein
MEIRLSSDIPQLGTFGDGMGDIASNEASSIANKKVENVKHTNENSFFFQFRIGAATSSVLTGYGPRIGAKLGRNWNQVG